MRAIGGATLVLALLVHSAVSAAPAETLTVVPLGDAAERARLAALDLGELPYRLRLEGLPNTPPAPAPRPGRDEEALVGARRAYVDADFARCLEQLGDEARALELLAEGRTTLSARQLALRVACRIGAADPERARADALRFATLELELPADVGGLSPEVEALLVAARNQVSALPRARLAVSAHARGAAVSVDGRRAVCLAPCAALVAPGRHVVRVEADGAMPAHALVEVPPAGAAVALEPRPADAALASQQWTERYARSADVMSEPSIRLLARALRAPRLVVLGPLDDQRRARGALAVDGQLRVEAELPPETGELPEERARLLLRDLLVRGRLVEPAPSLWQRPAFWVVVGLATAAIAATIVLISVSDRPVRTEVRF